MGTIRRVVKLRRLFTEAVPPAWPASRAFARFSLARQFMVSAALLLSAVVVLVGHELGERVEAGVVNRTAALAAAYFESMLSPRLLRADLSEPVDAQTRALLDQTFGAGPLASRVVRFKLWSPDGSIFYASDHAQIGSRFALHDHHALALSGRMVAAITDLDGPDNGPERRQWSRLIEIYLPLRDTQGRVRGIAEFYHEVDSVQAEIVREQRQLWIVLLLSALLGYTLLSLLVRRGSLTIDSQRAELARQVRALTTLLAENRAVRQRLEVAGAKTTAMSELALRRVAADIHDGPVQDLSFALLCPLADDVRAALERALHELRAVAAGMTTPATQDLTLSQVILRAVSSAGRAAPARVDSDIADDLGDAPAHIKLTAFRVVQEGLSNALRHGGPDSPLVRARGEEGWLRLDVIDKGPGFDPARPATDGHLGLAFLRERVALVGGRLVLDSSPRAGTRLSIWLPLPPSRRSAAGGAEEAGA